VPVPLVVSPIVAGGLQPTRPDGREDASSAPRMPSPTRPVAGLRLSDRQDDWARRGNWYFGIPCWIHYENAKQVEYETRAEYLDRLVLVPDDERAALGGVLRKGERLE
jgi:hypothetical protein